MGEQARQCKNTHPPRETGGRPTSKPGFNYRGRGRPSILPIHSATKNRVCVFVFPNAELSFINGGGGQCAFLVVPNTPSLSPLCVHPTPKYYNSSSWRAAHSTVPHTASLSKQGCRPLYRRGHEKNQPRIDFDKSCKAGRLAASLHDVLTVPYRTV